jgi:GNAT superfamily N-acetyltransferase
VHMATSGLPGEETMVGAWQALATVSSGARLVCTETAVSAVFPAWAPLNNAILRGRPSTESASAAAATLRRQYDDAGIASWALWVPSRVGDFDSPDAIGAVRGMSRDTTTVVMTRPLEGGFGTDPRVRRTTIEAAIRAGDEPVPTTELPEPDRDGPCLVDAWTLIDEGSAVTSALTHVNGRDVGIYAVGTAPGWRRRGLARALMLHVLADAHRRGARTASLQSTRMGEALYRAIGFVPVGRYAEWVPTTG